MAIVGGALVPPLQGMMADTMGLQISFVLPVVCYLYIMYYGLRGYFPKGPGMRCQAINKTARTRWRPASLGFCV